MTIRAHEFDFGVVAHDGDFVFHDLGSIAIYDGAKEDHVRRIAVVAGGDLGHQGLIVRSLRIIAFIIDHVDACGFCGLLD